MLITTRSKVHTKQLLGTVAPFTPSHSEIASASSDKLPQEGGVNCCNRTFGFRSSTLAVESESCWTNFISGENFLTVL